MDTLPRSEIIGIFSFAIAVLSVIAAALALQKKVSRSVLIFLTCIGSVTFYIYLHNSFGADRSAREVMKTELADEIRRELAKEQAEKEEIRREARELVQRENAKNTVKEVIVQEKVEQETREAIAREDAVKKLRDQLEAEKAEQAKQAVTAGIVGRWKATTWWANSVEFTEDGRCVGLKIFSLRYRVVDATHIEVKNWFGSWITWEVELSGDTLHFQGGTFTRVK
jgi:apolipoprotein N-acyltransferase